MKKLRYKFLLLTIIVLPSFALSAQHQHENYGKKYKNVVVVKKTHPGKYPRNKVVVVKKRNFRTVAVLPKGYNTVVYRNNHYYQHGGYYYRNINNTYMVVRPPKGFRIKVLPAGYHLIIMAGKPHFYYKGVYYRQSGQEFETVDPEIGTIVPDIPQEVADQVKIDDVEYYEISDYLYKPVETPKGIQYEFAGELEDSTEE